MNNPLLKIPNRHAGVCGEPPAIVWGESTYIGYFENQLREQWVISIDRKNKTGLLFGGDIGWDNPVPIFHDNQLDIVLGDEEIAWLTTCWRTAVGGTIESKQVGPIKVLTPRA